MNLAIAAFGSLGIELLYVFLLKPFLFGTQMGSWSSGQSITHWILTCVTWGIVGIWLGHILSKGDLLIGLHGFLWGILLGIAYLVVNKDIRKAWIVMFVL